MTLPKVTMEDYQSSNLRMQFKQFGIKTKQFYPSHISTW